MNADANPRSRFQCMSVAERSILGVLSLRTSHAVMNLRLSGRYMHKHHCSNGSNTKIEMCAR
eukprot:2954329-Pleurochrysis_carterae.AAC.4